MQLDFDANNRINPVFSDLSFINNDQVKRITNIALPFLSLWQPTAILSTTVLGGQKIFSHIQNIRKPNQNWKEISKEVFLLAFTVTTVALTILGPLIGLPLLNLAITQSYQLAVDTYNLGCHLRDKNWTEAGKSLLSICHTLIYCAAVISAAPELLAISLSAQAAIEIYKAYKEFRKGDCDYLAMIANILMASIRLYQAAPHLQTTHRNWLGKQMTQTDWDELMLEMKTYPVDDPDDLYSMEAFLIEHYYSSYIKGITVSDTPITNIAFINNRFTECNFENANLINTLFLNTTFSHCSLDHAKFVSAFFNTSFNYCTALDTQFNTSFFANTTFKSCDVSGAFFNDSLIFGGGFVDCKMRETNFFNALVLGSSIVDSDLTDTLLVDNKDNFEISGGTPHVMTRPVVALSWDFWDPQPFATLIDISLKEQNAIVLKHEYNLDIDPDLLELEVKNILGNYKSGELSRAQTLFQNVDPDSEIGEIVHTAQKLALHVDAIQIPGSGADVEPILYGAIQSPKTHSDIDMTHTIYELALIHFANEMKIPTQGICRGAQLINVYFNGTLEQHVDDQFGALHWIRPNQTPNSIGADMVRGIMGDGMVGLSMHHQAIKDVGNNLQVLAQADGVVKIIVSQDGVFLGSQIHPEISAETEISNEYGLYDGKKFFENLANRAIAYRANKIA